MIARIQALLVGIGLFVVLIVVALSFNFDRGQRAVMTGDMREQGVNVAGSPSISRSIDYEAGVVCWIYSASSQGGISCLPLSVTTLDARQP